MVITKNKPFIGQLLFSWNVLLVHVPYLNKNVKKKKQARVALTA